MLDPQDWAAFRAVSHAMLDAALDRLEHVRDEPAWRSVPDALREHFTAPLPRDGTSFEEVCREFTEAIAPYPTGNIHPRFFGWVHGTGTPSGAIAELLAAAMNANVGGREHAAVYVERQVIAWARELFGFPAGASGVLTVGSSTANLIAVLVARSAALGAEAREHGVDPSRGRLIGYGSAGAHSCVLRAFEIAGLGAASLRLLPVDAQQRLEPARLATAIAEDRARGLRPFLVIGNAGTVDTGAIDPLEALAEIATRERLWYHVDGAFGAAAMLVPALAPRLRGVERADSLAFDFHKWLHVPYDAGCVLVRDEAAHRAAFASTAPYLHREARGTAGGTPWFTDYTPDLSRGFRALKVWFTIKEHGARRLGEAVERNVRQAALLGEMIAQRPHFELLAPVQLNIVVFRYRAPGRDDAALDAFNESLAVALQESGVAVTSLTTIGGRRALRVNITNHRTTEDDLTVLLEALERLAREMP